MIRIIENPAKTTPHALNLGIKASLGDFVIILSAHAQYPSDYCEKLVSETIRLNAACTGPVLETKTIASHKTANAIKNVLSDRLGVGSRFRTGSKKIESVDTVAFGCYPIETFKHYGIFDERLIRNQDIELNKRIIRGGGKIYLIPDVVCSYFARDNFGDFSLNNFQNGYWNILTPYYTGTFSSLSLRHFVPLVFVLSLILPILFSTLYPVLLWIWSAIFITYVSIIGIRSWYIRKKTTWLHQILAFFILHFSYGIGSIGGIIAITKKILSRDSV